MHGWLPTMSKNFIHNTTQCPGCVCLRKTTNHLLVCPNQVMKAKREEIVAALRKKGLGPGVPRSIANAIRKLMEAHFRRTPPPSFLKYHPAIQRAVQMQLKVGTNMFLRGFIVKGWYNALMQMEVSRPSNVIKSILTYCWDTVIDSIWETRNSILHCRRNMVDEAEESQLTERLV